MSERLSPLEEAWRAQGAQFRTHRGCRLPSYFIDPSADTQVVRTAAGVIDRTDRAHLTATGNDAVRFLHGMLSNEVKNLLPGQGVYATQLNPQGQMIADLYLLSMGDHLLLETDWLVVSKLRQILENYVIADDVLLEDRSQQLAALSVEGPAAGNLLTAAGAVVLPGAELNHTWVELRTPHEPESKTPVLLVRLSETGEEGFRLIFVVEFAQNVLEALVAQQAILPWKPVGWDALNILRTEAGIPWYGMDMDERTLPPEAGLEARAISYTKGCYMGQEIIERIRSRGHVNRQLSGLWLETPQLPAPGTKLVGKDKEVGTITTAVQSPTLGRPIALGYVRREYRDPGTRLSLEGGGAAEVTPLPFYRGAR